MVAKHVFGGSVLKNDVSSVTAVKIAFFRQMLVCAVNNYDRYQGMLIQPRPTHNVSLANLILVSPCKPSG